MFLVTASAGFGGRGTAPWDISGAHYDGVSFSSTALADIGGIFFKDDGTKFYATQTGSPAGVQQFSLSTPWEVSSATHDGLLYTSSSEDTQAYGIFIGSSGTKMYICGNAKDKVFQYTLSTAWASSTATYDGVSLASSAEDTSPTGIFFKDDGTKLFLLGTQNDKVFQYTLSTAWASSTAVYDSVSFSSTNIIAPSSLVFNNDGTKAFIVNNGSVKGVYRWGLTTPWGSSTANYDSVMFSYAQSNTATAAMFSGDGSKLYILIPSSDETIYQYSL